MRFDVTSFLSFLTLLVGAPTIAAGQDCSGTDMPCDVAGGSYHLMVPEAGAPSGIVMHLHGGGGTGKGQMNSGLAKEALARGYVVVTPSGEHPENRWSRDWSVQADNMSFERDDITFLRDVLADARRQSDVAQGPVLLAGFSRGGSMVWNMACFAPDFATAYAPLAGAFWDRLPDKCDAPVKLFHTHGWTDRTVPLEGRSFSGGTVVQGDVWASLKVLRETNGCKNRQPERSSFDGSAWFRHWTDCEAGQIDLMLHQGGHGAPDGWATIVLDWFEQS